MFGFNFDFIRALLLQETYVDSLLVHWGSVQKVNEKYDDICLSR